MASAASLAQTMVRSGSMMIIPSLTPDTICCNWLRSRRGLTGRICKLHGSRLLVRDEASPPGSLGKGLFLLLSLVLSCQRHRGCRHLNSLNQDDELIFVLHT